MKTAEEWTNNQPLGCDDCEHIAYVKQIQLDAMKEGMRRAAEVSKKELEGTVGSGWAGRQIAQAILTTAEQLTEKDL